MDVRRARLLARAVSSILLLTLVVPMPVRAAACALEAPYAVHVGDSLTIAGTSFPSNTSVDISIVGSGGSTDLFAVQSNASGTIQLSLVPETADEGTLTVTASAGASCRAEVQVVVVAAGASLPPEPEPEPVSDGGTAGEAGGAPRTDSTGLGGSSDASGTAPLWLFAMLLVAIGGSGLAITARGREG